MAHSLARLVEEPVLLARKRCNVCHGDGQVPTPEFAGWTAKVERIDSDLRAAAGGMPSQGALEAAHREAGAAPEPRYAPCRGCEGRGYNEVEVSLEKLAELLNGDKAA